MKNITGVLGNAYSYLMIWYDEESPPPIDNHIHDFFEPGKCDPWSDKTNLIEKSCCLCGCYDKVGTWHNVCWIPYTFLRKPHGGEHFLMYEGYSHEYFHAFQRTLMSRMGYVDRKAPQWWNEGFADLFEIVWQHSVHKEFGFPFERTFVLSDHANMHESQETYETRETYRFSSQQMFCWYLIKTRGTQKAIFEFADKIEALGDWKRAFSSLFSVSHITMYDTYNRFARNARTTLSEFEYMDWSILNENWYFFLDDLRTETLARNFHTVTVKVTK
jgi:hypothetical protein